MLLSSHPRRWWVLRHIPRQDLGELRGYRRKVKNKERGRVRQRERDTERERERERKREKE